MDRIASADFPMPKGLPLPKYFAAKKWIYLVQLLVFSGLAAFSLLFGMLFWSGTMKDANDQPRPEAGPPMVIMGVVFTVIALLAFANICGRRRPLIAFYREGMIINLVGVTSLDGIPVPALARLAWSIISLQGFRKTSILMPWESFESVEIGGLPMAHILILAGPHFNLQTARVSKHVVFKEVAFTDPLRVVHDVIQCYFSDPAAREQLPQWE